MTTLPFGGREPDVWLLIDDRAGNKSQVMGVARALGFKFIIKDLIYTPAAALPNYMLMASFGGLTQPARVNLGSPWPDVVIAAGRRTAPVARKIKKMSGGKTFLMQIMHPGSGSGEEEFDLIAVPRHDNMPEEENRLQITGAPHQFTKQSLGEYAYDWKGKFDHLPKPWVALIVGGSTKRKIFTDEHAEDLAAKAVQLAKDAGGSLLVTTSRRTGDAAAALKSAVEDSDVPNMVFSWGDEGDNPYAGYLAYADHIIVSGDSVSMCSEACATPRPVYIYAPKKLTVFKHKKLHEELYKRGMAKPLEGTESLLEWTHDPLNAAQDIAAEMKRRLGYED